MNLKHIKVALKCIPINKLFLCHFSPSPPPLLSSLVQCTVWKPRGCIEHSVDMCAPVVSCHFDLIAVNMTLVKRRQLFAICRASVCAAERSGVSLHVAPPQPRERRRHRVLQQVAGSGQLFFACRRKDLLCCMFNQAKDLTWTLMWNTTIALR